MILHSFIEMTTSYTDTPAHLLIFWISFAVLGNIISIMLLICHFYIYFKREIKETTTSRDRRQSTTIRTKQKSLFYKIMSLLTLLSMTAFTISILIATVNHFSCFLIFDKLSPVLYQFAKCCIYQGFIMRLYHVFNRNRSGHAINDKILASYGILIAMLYSVLCIWGYLDLQHDVYSFDNARTTVCKKTLSVLYLICSLSVDVTNTIVLLVAYITPVMKIIKSLKIEFSAHHVGRDFRYPVTKISILTLVATVSSIAAHVISMTTTTYIAFVIDIPINVLCVMLMTPYYSRWYDKLCCGLIKCSELCTWGKSRPRQRRNRKIKEKEVTTDALSKQEETVAEVGSVGVETTTKMEETKYETRTCLSSKDEPGIKYEPLSVVTKTILVVRSQQST
eukprot:188182_1